MRASTANEPPHRVLVVDDEPNIVDVISMALRFQGFQVAAAGNGRDALAAVRSFDHRRVGGRGRAGAGLGLAIVAAIVAAHGGHAQAADAEGGGARFEVSLPLAGTRAADR